MSTDRVVSGTPVRGALPARRPLRIAFLIALLPWVSGALAQGAPSADGPLHPKGHKGKGHAASEAAIADTPHDSGALTLEERRKRFFEHVDEFGSESPVPGTVNNSVFPVGPDGLPIVQPKLRRR